VRQHACRKSNSRSLRRSSYYQDAFFPGVNRPSVSPAVSFTKQVMWGFLLGEHSTAASAGVRLCCHRHQCQTWLYHANAGMPPVQWFGNGLGRTASEREEKEGLGGLSCRRLPSRAFSAAMVALWRRWCSHSSRTAVCIIIAHTPTKFPGVPAYSQGSIPISQWDNMRKGYQQWRPR